ncbi:PREDICTED: LOC103629423 isoform [Prunus dulcis]|uniref:PREDICTED: LOC103629423 isoform n=1 Tax=Prunus dulcis TaxID=3755 RepID=A0A5E4F1Y7_PRUDU|nr:PREDICTED: LOC103629423 isoform [Prunus dulcis]
MYLEGVESRRNRPNRNANHGARNVPGGFSIFLNSGHHIGRKGLSVHMDEAKWQCVSRYVLSNCPEVQPFERRHKLARRANRGRRTLWEANRESAKNFPSWFKKHVKNMKVHGAGSVHEDLCPLASGPSRWCKKYKRYVINGYQFRVKKFDKKNKTQNSGVFATSEVTSYASTHDTNPIDGRVDYYGVLTDIIEIDYHNDLKILLFDCDWPNTSGRNNGVKADIHGFQLEKDWHVARKTKPRDLFDMNNTGHIDHCEPQNLDDALIEDEEIEVRTDVLGITINRLLPLQVPAYSEGGTDEESNSDDEFG